MKVVIPMMGMGRSGGERVLAKLANALVDKGEDVYIVAPESNCLPYYPLDSKVVILKSKVKKSKFKVFNFFCNMYYLLCKSRAVNADVAIANYHITAYIVALLKSSVNKFYYIQAYEVNFSQRYTLKVLAFFSYLLPLKKIVNSKLLLPSYINNYIEVIPPGIDLDLFKSINKKIDTKKLKIGFVGRREPYKGSREIIDVLSKFYLNKSFDFSLNVAVYMDDNWRSKIESFNFHEIHNDEQLADFYKLNDIIIATGLIEDGAFHYPCAEAIASNCLVISNYAPLINGESILSLKSFDKEELAKKIEQCFELSQSDIINELASNYQLVKDSSWSIVGDKFHKILLHM